MEDPADALIIELENARDSIERLFRKGFSIESTEIGKAIMRESDATLALLKEINRRLKEKK